MRTQMKKKDLETLESLLKRTEDLPDILNLRAPPIDYILTEGDKSHLLKTYEDLDAILKEVIAFINIKFPERKDHIIRWNEIDFDTKIGDFKVVTSNREHIKSEWKNGLFDLKDLIKTLINEVTLLVNEEDQANNEKPTERKTKVLNFLEKYKVLLTLGILIFAVLTYFGIKPDNSPKSTSEFGDEKNENFVKPQLYEFYSGILKEGEAFVDSLTQATIGISEVNYYKQISGNIKLPNSKNENFEGLMPGHSWAYEFNNKSYLLIYVLGDFMSDEFAIKVIETNNE